MSERQIPDPQSTPQAPASVDASAQLASARRRKFIKLGGAAVPTALTLASRPVMAWNCNTASTWGSAQGVSTTHSSYVRSRDSTRLFADETYTLSCWVTNGTRQGLAINPWNQSPLGCNVSKTSASNYYKKYTVASLLNGEGSILGIGDTSVPVWNILKNDPTNYPLKTGNSSTDFTRLMLVAWLNYRVQNAKLLKCLKPGMTNSLVKFGNGSYVDIKGNTWLQADVVKYLKKNYIACNDDGCA